MQKKKRATLSVENLKMVINQQKLISFNYHHDLEILNNISDKSTRNTSLGPTVEFIYIWGGFGR